MPPNRLRDSLRLAYALGVSGPGAQTAGLVLGLLICAAVGGSLLALKLTGKPAVGVYGAVVGLGFEETDHGSQPYASISVDERAAHVGLPRASVCQTGDRIALHRREALLGYRYAVAPEGCTRP